MKKQMSNWMLFMLFAALTGVVIAVVIWLYLKIANVGITVIWNIIPEYFDVKYYTIVMCLVGGVLVGLFHKVYGPHPESMADSVKRVKNTGSYPFDKLHITVLGAFLSLFFGGAVGPESGLVCLLLGMVFWAMAQFGMGRLTMMQLLHNNPYVSRRYVFKRMASGLFKRANQIVYDKTQIQWKRSEQITAGVVCGIVALIVYESLNALLGAAIVVPHLAEGEMFAKDRLSVILLIAVGIGSGYLFLIFKKINTFVFGKLRKKKLDVLSAVLGGLILGLIGTAIPMTMFSGGNDIQAMQYEYLQFTPYLLILIGVVKLFLTNVCIESGWRGGHFFPVVFSGISIGYGFSVILHTPTVLSVVVVTSALMATMMQQPIGAIVLALFFFPLQELGWIVLASFVGGCVPVPRAIRVNPDNRGFVYNISHMNMAKRLPMK